MNAPRMLVVLNEDDLRAVVAGAVEEALAAGKPSRPQPEPLLGRRDLARALGCSLAQVDRLRRQGMPMLVVGSTPKADLGAVRAWLATRGTP